MSKQTVDTQANESKQALTASERYHARKNHNTLIDITTSNAQDLSQADSEVIDALKSEHKLTAKKYVDDSAVVERVAELHAQAVQRFVIAFSASRKTLQQHTDVDLSTLNIRDFDELLEVSAHDTSKTSAVKCKFDATLSADVVVRKNSDSLQFSAYSLKNAFQQRTLRQNIERRLNTKKSVADILINAALTYMSTLTLSDLDS